MGFYQDLVSTGILAGLVSESDGNFWNAYEIYEWARYMYTHNETVFEGLDNANETLTQLETHALDLARAKLTIPRTADGVSEESAIVTTVAGRSLAKKIVDQFKSNIRWAGGRDKLSLMFGSYEPLLSFLSITGVLTREELLSGPFSRFPDHGAALVIELISDDDDTSDDFPNEEDLSVRMYYRENANEDTPFEIFSLLNSGLSGQSIPYTSFAREMNEEGLTSDEWCTVCNAQQAPFCPTAMNLDEVCENTGSDDDRGIYGPNYGPVHPAIAGIIGAVVFGLTAGFALATLYYCFGFRVSRVGPEERSSVMGGFKGPEKKPDDADVEVTRAGTQQERVGSWEMRGDSDVQGVTDVGVAVKGPSQSRAREVDQWREDDEISLVGATPVAVRESV